MSTASGDGDSDDDDDDDDDDSSVESVEWGDKWKGLHESVYAKHNVTWPPQATLSEMMDLFPALAEFQDREYQI